jgi:hemerythrin
MGSWNGKYKVGIEIIDEQHKQLFNILDRCFEVLFKRKDKDNYDDIIQILEELKDYAVYHFSTEENFMQKNNYTKFLSHKFAHDSFIEKINSFDPYNIDKDQDKAVKEIFEFVSMWIKNHIIDIDMNIPKYIPKK